MRSLHGQRGLSSLGWVGLLIVVGFAAIVAIRLVPVYLDYYAVLSAAQSVQKEGALSGASAEQMRKSLRKRMQINDVDDLGADIVKIKRSRNAVELLVDYEVREPLIGNIDLVLHFNRRIAP